MTHLRVDANVPPAAPSEAQLRGILQSLERDALAEMSIDQIEHLVDPDPGLAAVRRPLSRYAGAYTNPAYGRFTVEVRNKRLVMTLGPAQIEAPLVRYRGDVFIAILPDHPQFEIPLKFLVDRNGLVTGLFVPALSDVNGGRFKRGG